MRTRELGHIARSTFRALVRLSLLSIALRAEDSTALLTLLEPDFPSSHQATRSTFSGHVSSLLPPQFVPSGYTVGRVPCCRSSLRCISIQSGVTITSLSTTRCLL
jgi:hypothetical protein